MTFLQICNLVRQEAGIAGSNTPMTCQGQTGELGRVVSWVQQAVIEICDRRDDWGFLRNTFAFQTVNQSLTAAITSAIAGTNTITLTNAAPNVLLVGAAVTLTGGASETVTIQAISGNIITTTTPILNASHTGLVYQTYQQSYPRSIIANLAKWKRDSFRIYLTSSGVTDERWLPFVDYDVFRDTRLRGSAQIQIGRPIEFTIDPQMNVITYPIPNAVYTIDGEYFAYAATLVNDTDTPPFDRFHMAIVYNALMRYAAYIGDSSTYARAQKDYNIQVQKLERAWQTEIKLGSPLA